MKSEPKRDDQCIKRLTPTDQTVFHSVKEYDEKVQYAKRLSRKARSFHEVIWTEDCPPVESLSVEFQGSNLDQVRICDEELYHAQMRTMLGIE